jgi:hypothetical protein
MATKPARIDSTGHVVTIDRAVKLSKSGNDQVLWIAQGTGGPWTVHFTSGSPFSTSTYTVPAGGTIPSGLAIVAAGGWYKYEVLDSASSPTDDPDVLIDL